MVDCHVHMILDGVDWKASIRRHAQGVDVSWVRKVLEGYRTAGFTYLRDGGDRWGAGKVARALAPEYGITYRTPLSNLCLAGHYGSFIGESFTDEKDFARKVEALRGSGADFIKIMISGLMDFDRFGVLTQESLPSSLIRRAWRSWFTPMARRR